MEDRQLAFSGDEDWRPAVGTRVLIVGKHPASGHAGTVTRREEWMGKLSIAVDCDSGLRPGVTNPANIKVLD